MMALNKVYAVYGSDIECNGLIKVFANKHDAEVFMKDVISYNKTRPYTDEEIVKSISSGDDAWSIVDRDMEAWKAKHPNAFADLYEKFFIAEIEVN